MLRPLALSICICLCLSSCQVFRKSDIWESVTRVTPGDCIRDPDPSAAYAAKLHHVLLEEGVEHIVATYQFHYLTHQRDEAVNTRTAIVYRDNVDRNYPWWLKDDRTPTPVWLPNGDLASQISFYIQRPAEVIEQQHYPAGNASGKKAVGKLGSASVKPRPMFADHSAYAVTRITPIESTSTPATKVPVPPQLADAKPSAGNQAATLPTTAKLEQPARVAKDQTKPVQNPQTPPLTAAARSGPSSSPADAMVTTVPAEQLGPREERLAKLFLEENATSYDPASSVDRQKMAHLKANLSEKENSDERRTHRSGVNSEAGASSVNPNTR